MKTRYYLLIVISIIFILIAGLFIYILDMNATVWREDGSRYHYVYGVEVRGLSGREAVGTTTVLVPIPATKDGIFVTTPTQEEPSFIQKLMHEYVLNTPERYRKGPYFENTTQKLDNKSINGKWTTFIAKIDDGYMLGFKTNESTLADISFEKELVVVDYIDIFDPINRNGPILYPIWNLSEISTIPYGDYLKYTSNPTYDSYVYLSDNIEEGTTNFNVFFRAHNDPTEWSKEYRGSYMIYVETDPDKGFPPEMSVESNSESYWGGITTNNTGKIKARFTLEQDIGHKSPSWFVQ